MSHDNKKKYAVSVSVPLALWQEIQSLVRDIPFATPGRWVRKVLSDAVRQVMKGKER